ncbi:carbohydrate-binding family 9-like protein [Flavobacteriaceae bacterium GSB9]|nr:carbohydrate-binding family 9-like protein [Flavobacteriaceae bacterium GSB9]
MQIKLRLVLIATICNNLFACSQVNRGITPKSYIAYKALDTILIDGNGTDESWGKSNWTSPFTDIEGDKKPQYDTKVKMLWDDKYFYILAKIEEPHVWGNLKRRDTIIFYNNDFEVFIDPDGDTHNYYELEINALNTVWDLFINKPYREAGNVVLNDWTLTGLKSAVKVNGTLNNPADVDEGWTLEMAIPWDAYKTSYYDQNVPKDKFWRVNFSRVNWQYDLIDGNYLRKKDNKDKLLPEYNWVWSPMGVINMHEPEKWGYVYFSSKPIGDEDTFSVPEDEKLKWKLFNVFRALKDYYKVNKKWATSLKSISQSKFMVEGKRIQPKLETHATGFNISVKSPFSGKTLIIKEDGKFISK